MDLIAEAEVTCPYCAQVFPLEIDTSQPEQTLLEDCAICCRPITLTIRCRPGAIVDLSESTV